MKKLILSLTVFTSLAIVSQANLIVTSFTTVEGFVTGAGGTNTLASITDADGTRSILNFATSIPTGVGGTILHGAGTSAPATSLLALTDNRIDTGTLGAGANERFEFSSAISATDKFFVFFNASSNSSFYDQPTNATVYAAGVAVGNVVSILDVAATDVGSVDFHRVGGSDLNDRPIHAFTLDVSEFGVGDPSTIDGISFGAPNSTDFNLIGFASVPEPSTFGLFGMAAVFIWFRRKSYR